MAVQQVDLRVVYRPPDRRRLARSTILSNLIDDASDHRLGRPILVHQLHAWLEPPPQFDRRGQKLLPTNHEQADRTVCLPGQQALSQDLQMRWRDFYQPALRRRPRLLLQSFYFPALRE